MRRVKMDVTIDPEILKEIDALRGREKRSTFVEHLLRIGLEACKMDNPTSRVSKKGKENVKEAR
ncbi:MAG: hypothetical protein QXD70_03580 [Candidatus Bathyarchaeia archaeon]